MGSFPDQLCALEILVAPLSAILGPVALRPTLPSGLPFSALYNLSQRSV